MKRFAYIQWASAIVHIQLCLAQASAAPACDCYRVNSSDYNDSVIYLDNHRFWDFRLLQDQTQTYLNSSAFTKDWGIMTWGRESSKLSPIAIQNVVEGVLISQDTRPAYSNIKTTAIAPQTYLSLTTTRINETNQATAEVENLNKDLMHASMRAFARINPSIKDRGACAGIFTYADENNEVDVELLTRDSPNTWRFTNQPAVDKDGNLIEQASLAPNNLAGWTDWHEIRIDWLPTTSNWYVDGSLVASNAYSVPRKASGLVLNMWSDGGLWTQEMAIGSTAQLDVQWVEVVFDTYPAATSKTASGKKGHCSTVCTIDGVVQHGVPEVVADSTPVSAANRYGHGLGYRLLPVTGIMLAVAIRGVF